MPVKKSAARARKQKRAISASVGARTIKRPDAKVAQIEIARCAAARRPPPWISATESSTDHRFVGQGDRATQARGCFENGAASDCFQTCADEELRARCQNKTCGIEIHR